MKHVPVNWMQFPLVELAEKVTDGAHYTPEFVTEGIPFITITHVRNGDIDYAGADKISQEAYETLRTNCQPHPGDVLFSKDGTVGRVAIVRNDRPAIVLSSLAIIRPSRAVSSEFLAYALQSPNVMGQILAMKSGVALRRVTLRNLGRTIIPLAPIGEQKRIVASLDENLAKLDAAVRSGENASRRLAAYRAAVLRAACEGRLVPTEAGVAWPEGKLNLAGWTQTTLGELAREIRSGSTAVPVDEPTQLPILRSNCVNEGKVDFNDRRFVPGSTIVREQDLLREDDLLFTRLSGSIEYVGRCGRVEDLHRRRIVYPDRLICVRLVDLSLSEWIALWANSPVGRAYFEGRVKSTAGHKRISLPDVREMRLAIPPPANQRDILLEVDRRLSVVERLEAAIDANLARAKRLRQAILKRAFEGRLVPQDPNDAPASVLLERIRDKAEGSKLVTSNRAPRKVRR